MTAGAWGNDKAFKRALTVSAAAHVVLFAFIVLNPALPKKATPKGVIHYLSMGAIGGGGNVRPAGGSGRKTEIPAAAAKPESLRDLTTPEKAAPKPDSKLRYPADESKTKRKPAPVKKATISKAAPGTKTGAGEKAGNTSGQTGGGGSGLKIGPEGTGTGTGGMFGDGFGDGLTDFPYAYYLNRASDKIQVNWFPSRIDPGPDNILQTLVYFRIYRNGTISTVEIKQASGIQAFDLIAVRAVTNAAPFPPLPDDYDGEYLGINLLFEHKR